MVLKEGVYLGPALPVPGTISSSDIERNGHCGIASIQRCETEIAPAAGKMVCAGFRLHIQRISPIGESTEVESIAALVIAREDNLVILENAIGQGAPGAIPHLLVFYSGHSGFSCFGVIRADSYGSRMHQPN